MDESFGLVFFSKIEEQPTVKHNTHMLSGFPISTISSGGSGSSHQPCNNEGSSGRHAQITVVESNQVGASIQVVLLACSPHVKAAHCPFAGLQVFILKHQISSFNSEILSVLLTAT